jgi:hypothetical protein
MPKSLMRRLDLLHVGILPVSPPRAKAQALGLAKARKRRIGACFGLGLVGGSALGTAALLVLLIHPEPGSIHSAFALADGPPAAQESRHPASAAAPTAPAPDATASQSARTAALPPILDAPFRTEVVVEPTPPPPPAVAKASWPAEVHVAAPAEAGDVPAAAVAQQSTPPHRPVGLSALGGPVGDAAPASPLGRRVWWRMPAAPWVPFDSNLSPN